MSGVALAAGALTGLAVLLAGGGRRQVVRVPASVEAASEPLPRPRPDRPQDRPVELPVDLALELVAGLLDAGAPVRQAVGLVEAALAGGSGGARAGDGGGAVPTARPKPGPTSGPTSGPRSGPGPGDGLAEVIALSESSGLPPAALLRARADDLRRDRATAHSRAVRRLGVQLVLPMGLCLLPAFVLLGVVPVVLDLLGLG